MSYLYTAENRLDVPHKYMYTSFAGKEFLASYIEDRLSRASDYLPKNEHAIAKSATRQQLRDAVRGFIQDEPLELDVFSTQERTNLGSLLRSVLKALYLGHVEEAQPWLARLIQRFEVTKKLYALYLPGFRRGEGSARDPARYAEFALCLAFAFEQTGHLQYLSTQLKLLDLLLSLEPHIVKSACGPDLIALLIEAELNSISVLAVRQGIQIDVV